MITVLMYVYSVSGLLLTRYLSNIVKKMVSFTKQNKTKQNKNKIQFKFIELVREKTNNLGFDQV